MENILVFAGFLIIMYLIVTSLYPAYQRTQRRQGKMDEIARKHENLRKMRKDLKYHADWARDRGERKKAEEIEEEVAKIDDELDLLKEQYRFIESEKSTKGV
mmetsp:Transcript_14160/g.15620  ORF Transcript_14160/g.15620 Transcript_14160/m.15620 type:complete len:102 (+) Transcript_14160:46-351(+)